MKVETQNPHLKKLTVDYLYHFDIDSASTNLKEKFGDVKYVVMGGPDERMTSFAMSLYRRLRDVIDIPANAATHDLAKKGGRYCMYKVGPVLVCNHGAGLGSLSILMHEMIKLLNYAEATNVCIMRMGSCGGIGVQPGTICITKTGYTELLEDYFPVPVLGKLKKTCTDSTPELRERILSVADKLKYQTASGNTVSTNCFYEAQGRIDGAFCNFSEADKYAWLKDISENQGIINFEMSAAIFLSMCNRAKVQTACLAVSIVNRLKSDQITNTKGELDGFMNNLIQVVIQLIHDDLSAKKQEI